MYWNVLFSKLNFLSPDASINIDREYVGLFIRSASRIPPIHNLIKTGLLELLILA